MLRRRHIIAGLLICFVLSFRCEATEDSGPHGSDNTLWETQGTPGKDNPDSKSNDKTTEDSTDAKRSESDDKDPVAAAKAELKKSVKEIKGLETAIREILQNPGTVKEEERPRKSEEIRNAIREARKQIDDLEKKTSDLDDGEDKDYLTKNILEARRRLQSAEGNQRQLFLSSNSKSPNAEAGSNLDQLGAAVRSLFDGFIPKKPTGENQTNGGKGAAQEHQTNADSPDAKQNDGGSKGGKGLLGSIFDSIGNLGSSLADALTGIFKSFSGESQHGTTPSADPSDLKNTGSSLIANGGGDSNRQKDTADSGGGGDFDPPPSAKPSNTPIISPDGKSGRVTGMSDDESPDRTPSAVQAGRDPGGSPGLAHGLNPEAKETDAPVLAENKTPIASGPPELVAPTPVVENGPLPNPEEPAEATRTPAPQTKAVAPVTQPNSAHKSTNDALVDQPPNSDKEVPSTTILASPAVLAIKNEVKNTAGPLETLSEPGPIAMVAAPAPAEPALATSPIGSSFSPAFFDPTPLSTSTPVAAVLATPTAAPLAARMRESIAARAVARVNWEGGDSPGTENGSNVPTVSDTSRYRVGAYGPPFGGSSENNPSAVPPPVPQGYVPSESLPAVNFLSQGENSTSLPSRPGVPPPSFISPGPLPPELDVWAENESEPTNGKSLDRPNSGMKFVTGSDSVTQKSPADTTTLQTERITSLQLSSSGNPLSALREESATTLEAKVARQDGEAYNEPTDLLKTLREKANSSGPFLASLVDLSKKTAKASRELTSLPSTPPTEKEKSDLTRAMDEVSDGEQEPSTGVKSADRIARKRANQGKHTRPNSTVKAAGKGPASVRTGSKDPGVAAL